MKEIPVTDVGPIFIGQTENLEAATGCTVLVAPQGMRAGLDVRGGGPASRETFLLNPLTSAQIIHAIVLAGGSAFGLGAANGVMQYLAEHGFGFNTGSALVPLVVQSDIYDLAVGNASVHPDAAMGYTCARLAMESPNYRDGNFGAGCGATVGKYAGMGYCMKSGIGSYAIQIDELKIGAIVVLNAFGDVYDWKNGRQIAGLLNANKDGLLSTVEQMQKSYAVRKNKFISNTTLCVIFTNAGFNKPQLCKIAGMAHNGLARSINPVHTSVDGDSIYAVSIGDVSADQDLIGTLAAEIISEAIIRAAEHADGAYGLPCMRDLQKNGLSRSD